MRLETTLPSSPRRRSEREREIFFKFQGRICHASNGGRTNEAHQHRKGRPVPKFLGHHGCTRTGRRAQCASALCRTRIDGRGQGRFHDGGRRQDEEAQDPGLSCHHIAISGAIGDGELLLLLQSPHSLSRKVCDSDVAAQKTVRRPPRRGHGDRGARRRRRHEQGARSHGESIRWTIPRSDSLSLREKEGRNSNGEAASF
jgi:hypothetical protein